MLIRLDTISDRNGQTDEQIPSDSKDALCIASRRTNKYQYGNHNMPVNNNLTLLKTRND